jgi:FixJ family two-component response regulator
MAVPIISIVDDDTAVRDSVGSLVRSAGYQSMLFESAQAFLDAGGVDSTDCLIVDFHMRGLSGLALQRLLKHGHRPIPVIIISAYHDEIRDAAVTLGAVAIFGKPFNVDALLAAIRTALESTPLS